ncbi:hypothetical protein B0H16DRAFT_1730796 [Mycena metata]|uniref:DUF6534 domain-containing protein n=1 Tax=Mycena metata TaxID=1033252 RepID=A0AAD7I886_9AGAR|nr:hypothetical protein B0H16DRAFT_1730796 [Mycena metata]
MGHYDNLVGSMLIGSWLAAMLYGLTLCKSWEYVARYPKDVRFRKGLLLCCVFSSSLSMVGAFANVYYPTVTFWGNPVELEKQLWGFPVYVMFNSVTGAMVDAFLIRRLYRLSNMLWLAVFLAIFVVVGLVGAILISVSLAGADYSSRNNAATGVVIFTAGTAGADILITIALIWKLVTMKTELIHRLVIGAIQTGSTTSTIVIVIVVSYYMNKESNVPTAFNYLMSPLYVVTLLYNLNLQRRDGTSDPGRSDNRVTDISLGLQFYRTTIVTKDSADGNALRTVDHGEMKAKEDTNGEPLMPTSSRA